jgi:uroporphyrinogen-III synthase
VIHLRAAGEERDLRMASQEGWEDAFREGLERTLVGSIGPVCTRGLEGHGLPVDFEPERPKLAILISGAAEAFANQPAG